MNPLIQFFNIVLYQPLLNLLILLYAYLPGNDFGVAIIVLTLIIKAILYPLSLKSIRSQRAMTVLQPKIKEIQTKFKDRREQMSRALMELYKQEKVSPFSGCLPLLLQLPILIALYQVFLRGLEPQALSSALYSFVPDPGTISFSFLKIIDLSQSNVVLLLALAAAALQFLQARISAKNVKPQTSSKQTTSKQTTSSVLGKKDLGAMFQSQMLYFFPILTFFIVWKLGGIVGLYWATTTLFSIGEQYLVKSKHSNQNGQKNIKKN